MLKKQAFSDVEFAIFDAPKPKKTSYALVSPFVARTVTDPTALPGGCRYYHTASGPALGSIQAPEHPQQAMPRIRVPS